MKQSLFDIGVELKALQQRLEEELIATGGDVSEGTAAEGIEKLIEGYEWRQKEKVDAYVGLIRNIEADTAMVASAMVLLAERHRVLVNQVERLKAIAKAAMEAQGIDKVQGVIHPGMRIQQAGVAPLEILEANPEKWPEAFVVVTKSIDKKKAKDAIKDPEFDGLDGFARMGERSTFLRVL